MHREPNVNPTDILQTRNRTLQYRQGTGRPTDIDPTDIDPTDIDPTDILRTSYGLGTSHGHPTDKEPDMTGHEGTTPL